MLVTALKALNTAEGQEEVEVIAEALGEAARMAFMRTGFGATRMINMLVGDPLPRIC